MSRPIAPRPPAARRWPRSWRLVRWSPWVALAAWSAVLTVLVGRHHHPGLAWGYTQTGTDALAAGGPAGGLHLYTDHPELQIGPLTFVLGLLVLVLPVALRSRVLWLVMTAAGPLLVAGVAVLARTSGAGPMRSAALLTGGAAMPAGSSGAGGMRPAALLTGGAAVLAAWSVLAIPGGHLEDVLALAFGLLATAARRRHRLDLAALAVAGAADVKPWALAFAALLLDPDAAPVAQLRAALVAAAGIVVVWLPFLAGDRALGRLVDFTIPNAADSALRVLGYQGGRTPGWDRPAELALGLVLGAVLSWRRRPEGVLLAVLVARTLLDPGTHTYYTAGLLLAALLFDACVAGWRAPWTTLAGFAVLYLPHLLLGDPAHAVFRGTLRLGFSAGALLVLVTALLARRAAADAGGGEKQEALQQ